MTGPSKSGSYLLDFKKLSYEEKMILKLVHKVTITIKATHLLTDKQFDSLEKILIDNIPSTIMKDLYLYLVQNNILQKINSNKFINYNQLNDHLKQLTTKFIEPYNDTKISQEEIEEELALFN